MLDRNQETTQSGKVVEAISYISGVVGKVIGFRRSGGNWLDRTVQKTLDAVTKTGFKKLNSAFSSENIFYGERSQYDVEENDFAEIDRLRKTQHDIEEIADDHDIDSLEKRFRYLIALERIAENLDLSRRHKENINDQKTAKAALENLRQQDPLNTAKNKLFFVTKALACLRKNNYDYYMTRENFHLPVVPEKDLRKEYLRQQIKLLFAEAAETACSDKRDFESFVRDIAEEIVKGDENQSCSVSNVAPQLWQNRDRIFRENPVEFIQRVYAEKLAQGTLTRTQIAHLDPKLYQAYASWIRPGRHPEDDLGLPMQQHVRLDDPIAALERKLENNRRSTQRWRNKRTLKISDP